MCYHITFSLFQIDIFASKYLIPPVLGVNRYISTYMHNNDSTQKHFKLFYSNMAKNHRHLFHTKIYAPSSSLLQGKHLPFTPSPFRLNIFRLFVILSLTQLYRYTSEIFLFSTATFKYKYRYPSDELDKNIQRKSHFLFFSHWNGYNHFRFALDFSYAFGIL